MMMDCKMLRCLCEIKVCFCALNELWISSFQIHYGFVGFISHFLRTYIHESIRMFGSYVIFVLLRSSKMHMAIVQGAQEAICVSVPNISCYPLALVYTSYMLTTIVVPLCCPTQLSAPFQLTCSCSGGLLTCRFHRWSPALFALYVGMLFYLPLSSMQYKNKISTSVLRNREQF